MRHLKKEFHASSRTSHSFESATLTPSSRVLLLARKIDPNVVIVFNDDLMDIIAPSYQEIGRDLPRIICQASLSLKEAVRCLLKADIILLSLSCMNVWVGHKMFFIVDGMEPLCARSVSYESLRWGAG